MLRKILQSFSFLVLLALFSSCNALLGPAGELGDTPPKPGITGPALRVKRSGTLIASGSIVNLY